MIEAISENPTANIILNGARLKAFSLRSEQDKDVCLSLPFNLLLEVLARQLGKKKKYKAFRLA